MKGAVASSATQRLATIQLEHQKLEGQLKKLTKRAYLTPSEQLEVARMKKLKLRAKDEMVRLRTG